MSVFIIVSSVFGGLFALIALVGLFRVLLGISSLSNGWMLVIPFTLLFSSCNIGMIHKHMKKDLIETSKVYHEPIRTHITDIGSCHTSEGYSGIYTKCAVSVEDGSVFRVNKGYVIGQVVYKNCWTEGAGNDKGKSFCLLSDK